MTENNKLFNALDQLQFNTNNDDLKALEEAILTDKNLKNIKADKGSDLYNFLNNNENTIDNIIKNNRELANDTLYKVLHFAYKTIFNNDGKVFSTNGFGINHINNNHFVTIDKNKKIIFDSVKDGRQVGRCCGIHALEGVLIAEELTKNGKNIEEFKTKHNNQLTETSSDDLIKQRKILFKMEILDALMSMVQKDNGIEITPPKIENDPDFVIWETGGDENERQKTNNATCIDKLYKLYFEEFQARCAALQVVKKELEPVVKEAQEQNNSVVPQQTQQENEVETQRDDKKDEASKVEVPEQSDSVAVPQQIKQERKVETKVQKPATQIVVEEPEEEQQDKTVVEIKEDTKKLDSTKPKQKDEAVNTEDKSQIVEKQDKAVNTQKTTEEEPHPSTDTQSSIASSTSTKKAPRYKVLERTETEEKDAGFETYDVNNQPIDIDDESVKLYNKFLDQVLEKFKKEGKIVNIDLIKEKVEEKLFACFSIRNEKGEIISEDHYSDKDKKDIALAKEDYKYTAEHSELIRNRFNTIEKALKEYNERLTGANKEVYERILKEQKQEKSSVSVNV